MSNISNEDIATVLKAQKIEKIVERGFIRSGLLALKNLMREPRLTRDEKRNIIELFNTHEQEIKDIIAKYFYLKDDTYYDLKDDIFREPILKLIAINSEIDSKNFLILEKYFDSKEKEELDEEEKKRYDLMVDLSADRYLFHSTLTKRESAVRKNGRQMSRLLKNVYNFELLEKYFADKKREDLNPEDQKAYDIIKKYGVDRKPGDIIEFLEHVNPNDPLNIIGEYDEIDIEGEKFHKGVHRYYALEDVEKSPMYFYKEMSYSALKKERAKLYQELVKKEKIYENR